MSATAFSSGDEVMERKIEITPAGLTKTEQLDEVYEVKRLITWISEGKFKMVALQFPDELLFDAPAVARRIQGCLTEAFVFILGDTSYGSCCVDEVGAQHYKADCIIHFGQACLSPTARLPVLYVFGKSDIDTDDCVKQIKENCSVSNMRAILAYDTTYVHAVDAIFSKLQKLYKNFILSKLSLPSYIAPESVGYCGTTQSVVTSPNQREGNCQTQEAQTDSCSVSDNSFSVISKCGRIMRLPCDESPDRFSVIFIGNPEGATVNNLMMTFNKCPFLSYNPVSKVFRRETINVNKALMKRYYLIERAKDANIVGIVAGTLGVAKYRDMIDHLKSLLKKAGKKSYTFVVGKLNPAKLANFAEVDVYVLVSCPESTLLDQSEFYRPIVSPFEMEIACNQAREWTGDYSTDFRELLPGASMHVEIPDSLESEKADVSLISNKVRTLGIRDSPEVNSLPGQDLVLRSESMAVTAVAENAGEFLTTRSWKGLEQRLGETPVTKAVEGQHGIAASYEHEPAS